MKPKTYVGLLAAGLWLAAGQSIQAQGTIRYVPGVNQPFAPFEFTYPLDVDGNGATDFTFQADRGSLKLFPSAGNFVLALPATPPDLGSRVIPIAAGVEIGNYNYDPAVWMATTYYDGSPIGSTLNHCVTLGCLGYFVDNLEAYIGFQFQGDDGTHYGWMLFEGSNPGGVLKEYAYNTEPGMPIFTAQVPEPSTWVLLGAGGFALWWLQRRRGSPAER